MFSAFKLSLVLKMYKVELIYEFSLSGYYYRIYVHSLLATAYPLIQCIKSFGF